MSFFEKFTEILDKYFVPIADKIGNQRHVLAVRDGVVATLPVTIVGSLFLILRFIPIPGYREMIIDIGLEKYLAFLSDGCFNIVALVAVMGVAYRLSQSYKMNDFAISNAIIAFVSFFITLMPGLVDGNPSFQYMGSKSLFVAIIVGLVSVEIIRRIVGKGLIINLPEGVPPAIAKSFASLIPAFITITFWGVVTGILVNTSFKTIHDMIAIIVGVPLRHMTSSLAGQLVAVLMVTLLWAAGIHGATIVGAIMDPIWLENTLHNVNLVTQGLDNVYSNGFVLGNMAFQDITMKLGGSGSTLGFVILMLWRARSKQLKEVGKLSIVPSLFNINEPVIFGTPIVMNPILIIPFIVGPMVTTSLSWMLMKWDFVKVPFAALPWTTPPIVLGFISSGFAISTAALCVVNVLVSMAIYYPFFKIYDKQLAEQEAPEEVRENGELAVEA